MIWRRLSRSTHRRRPRALESVRSLNALEITSSDLIARCSSGLCTCDEVGCNEQAILTILTNLQATIATSITLLDGVTNPSVPAAAICTAINVAVQLLTEVKVNISTAGPIVVQIVNIIVHIVLALATCVSAYGPIIAVTLALQFDAALSLLIKTCGSLIPGLLGLVGTALNADITLLTTVKFVLTLIACNLPCGC